jgi:redox-sensing transcriptional repressor
MDIMKSKKQARISPKVVPRLSRYYRILYELDKQPWVSSRELSETTGFTAAQIRRDLGCFGQFGLPGKGYNSEELKSSIRSILGLDRAWNVALVGAGNLGRAFLGYQGFVAHGFAIVAAFDTDSRKAGTTVNGVEVHPFESLQDMAREKDIRMAILAVPAREAQKVAEQVVAAGVKGILNFAPVHLRLPKEAKVRNIDMTIEIERLSFLVSRE